MVVAWVVDVSEAKLEVASAEEAEVAAMELQYWSLNNWTTEQPPTSREIFPSNSSIIKKIRIT